MRRIFYTALPQTVINRLVFVLRHSSDSMDNKIDENSKLPQNEGLPNDSDMLANYKKLKAELIQAKNHTDELNKNILYSAAEADNFRKESLKSIQSAKQFAVTEFAKDMLETADNLEKVNSLCESYRKENNDIPRSIQSILNGLELSHKVVLQVFERQGVERFETKIGDKFSSHHHNQLFTTPSSPEFPPNTITKIVKNGYQMCDTLLRASEVGVSEAPEN
ncbi:unnamed protein product [Phytomonas sp. Hart1]|nr:unnamed protein product [Phytomonas sp. Hart1]|eukprot:CCW67987.1 unnamed protein product [Phytomonas sp. isolate Hart1]